MDGNYVGFHQSPARSVWEQVRGLSVKEVLIFFWAPVRVAWIYRRLALGKMDLDTACGIILSNPSYIGAFQVLHDQVVNMGNNADTSMVPVLAITAINRMESRGKTVQQLVSELNRAMAMWRPLR